MTKDNGGPAFPRPQAETSIGGNHEQVGMSLRDWFAGQALNTRYANEDMDGNVPKAPEDIAAWAYQVADALLAARAKGGDA